MMMSSLHLGENQEGFPFSLVSCVQLFFCFVIHGKFPVFIFIFLHHSYVGRAPKRCILFFFSIGTLRACLYPPHAGECKDAALGSVEPQSYVGVAARQVVCSAPYHSCLQWFFKSSCWKWNQRINMEGNCEKSVNNDEPEVKLKGRALLIYDLKQRRLIPTKILFFVVLSSKSLTICFNCFRVMSSWLGDVWNWGQQRVESAEK
jgi:hypothetical protein